MKHIILHYKENCHGTTLSYWNAASSQKLPENLTVYGYRYTAKGGDEETALYKYITNKKNEGIKFVDLDDEAKLLGDIRWNYDSSAKKLTISGKGEIPAVSGGTAWSRYASEIEEIEIEKGVTSIAAGAFTGMTELKTVTINRTVTNIDAGAFKTSSSNFTIKAKRNSAAKTFAEKNGIKFEEIVTANILFIGNSYTEDAREYLRYVFNQYNFPAGIHFGHLFSGGKTLAYYANTARQETVEKNENVSFIVPIGTAVENARGTYINQFDYTSASQNNIAKVNLLTGTPISGTMTPDNNHGIQRDETHMSAVVGRFLAGYTMGEKLVNHINGLGGAQFTNKTAIEQIYSYDPNIGLLPAEYVQTIKACADAAMASPYTVTQLTDHKTDPVQAVKTLVESADFTNTEWNETAIKAKAETVLAEKTGAKVTSVKVSGNTAAITLRYGYSEATATIYTPSDAAVQWTSCIESTKLGSTTVPGSDMKYSEVPQIQKAMADGYSAIWAAKTEAAADAALETAKTNLLTAVKTYVKFLLDTVYNSGKETILGDVAYTLPKEAYTKASGDIDAATTEADVLNAYDTALKEQTSKQHPILKKTEAKAATYTETGNHEYYTCETCGKVFKDAAGTQETTVEAETIAKLTRPSSGGSSSGSGRSYAVTAPSTKNGDVTVSPKNASKGDRVTITVTPDKGYELDSLTVKDASGNKLKLTDKGNGKYTFTMPGSKVTVSAEFVEEQAASIFADVPADAYYAKAVEWAVKKGITNGKANGLFGSNDPCTRGQIVTFLWRAAGSPAPKGTVKVPSDVLPGSYCYDAVAWALENDITNGLADGTFGVNNTCTRGQSVTFLYRAVGKAPSTISGFTDVAADSFCADAVAWAVENGVTNGTSTTMFSPNTGCTRAQIVTFLYRAYQGK